MTAIPFYRGVPVTFTCGGWPSRTVTRHGMGLAQPNFNPTRDAPPVAVSRVGCCELSLACSSVTAKSSRSCYIVSMPTNLHRRVARTIVFTLLSRVPGPSFVWAWSLWTDCARTILYSANRSSRSNVSGYLAASNSSAAA